MNDIEASSSDEKPTQVKQKRERTKKQIEVFERARKIRAENLRFKQKSKQENIEEHIPKLTKISKPVQETIEPTKINKKQVTPIVAVEAKQEPQEEIKPKIIKKKQEKKDKMKFIAIDDNSSSSSEEYIIRRVKKNKNKIREIAKRFNPFEI